ncbi:OLC1v1001577C3 [Oldenlandia corymbosa var. corymbosa]|uniref:OLC1v1001577C3 n=1 Tax=Oldenlandia corymbosa var. corymbosa TaxID=529605 RepID=A0AAV1D5L0_OLDCO|nr:OLC1v1001577C3 [Oldenlandia corymbosa var. corymbosa]
MEKAKESSLFVNDGSFMERFKQLQQEEQKEKEKNASVEQVKSGPSKIGNSTPKLVIGKPIVSIKANGSQRTSQTGSSGKLAFSLKQKSRLVAPQVKFDEDEDEEGKEAENSPPDMPSKRQKLDATEASQQSARQVDVAPPSPSDPTVKKVADKLASFVAKNGRQFEHITRQKNPGDTPFKFLFDQSCSDYKYYEYQLNEEEKALSQVRDTEKLQSVNPTSANPSGTRGSQRSYQNHSKYQIPASALYETEEIARASTSVKASSAERSGDSVAPTDPIAMMEYYMKKAAQEEKLRPPKASKDEMPPPASLQASGKKGHHMGDYIPQEELDKFMASCNDAAAQKAAKEAADKAKIQADNIGHKLLSKMGWKEGIPILHCFSGTIYTLHLKPSPFPSSCILCI